MKDEETQSEGPQMASLRKSRFSTVVPPKSPDFPESFVSSLCQVPGTGLLSPLLKEASSANGARGRGLGQPYLSGPTILATLKYNHVHFFLFFNVKGFTADL